MGEMTHGTDEFYRFRYVIRDSFVSPSQLLHSAEFTKELITKKGFTIVAVEGGWPDVYRANRFVKSLKPPEGETATSALGDFKRHVNFDTRLPFW